MYEFSLEELKEKIAAQLSIDEIVDILQLNVYDFVEYLEGEIENRRQEFLSALGEVEV
ncbi:MAG TPA: hypothetical protein VFM18_04850 [Methanosarcina sp.]|nr:hypothetical protein [Methanosarcina sp.]